MLSLPSQLLLRNRELFDTGRWAIVNPSDTAIFAELGSNIMGLHQQFDSYKAMHAIAPEMHLFSAAFSREQIGEAFDGVVIYMPKAKQHLDMLLANMAHLIKPNSLLMVVGENKGGIKSVAKQLEKFGHLINKLDSAKHCGLITCTVETVPPSFDIGAYGVVRSYDVNALALKIYSLPGVFGHKQFDPGTQLLLQQFAQPEELRKMRGKLYDFACGTGVIGSYFKKANPKLKVTMSDISALAVFCSEQTLALNELEADVVASDGMQEIHQHFEHIVSNPPFHDGLKNEYGITQAFIKHAYAKGNRGSRLTMVANRFLPYPEHIEKTFFKYSVLCQTNKFCVYQGLK
ncbi:methyltransferase [Glaciecola sp. SC05]|uniref:methyltransferase n=1 Tax=Glaciecola sp. SC05 TaxID=1987355 RepID=UPI0035286FF0